MSGAIPLLMNAKAGAMHVQSAQEQLLQSAQEQLLRLAHEAGVDVHIIHTQSADDLRHTLKQLAAQGTERVGVAGGDGTVGLAVQELAHTNTALGILSQGTFNNFASTLRLPHNLPESLRMLKDGVATAVDLGKIGDRYFTESAGVGLFADSLALYGQGTNKNFGRGLYTLARLGFSFQAREFTLTLDGHEVSGRAVLCEVCNTYRIAQAVPLAPEADVADGLLDVVILGDIPRDKLLDYARALRAQMHLGLPHVAVVRAREIKIDADHRRNVHADDQVVGETAQTITVQPGALKVLVDPRL